jgi:hypothetical protein
MKKSIIAVVLTVALIVSFSWSRPAEAAWTLWDDFNNDLSQWYTPVTSGDPTPTVGLDGNGNLALSGSGVFSVALGAMLDVSSIKGGAFTYSGYNVSSAAAIYLAVGNPDSGDFYLVERLTATIPGIPFQNFLVAAQYVDHSMVGNVLGFLPYGDGFGGLGIQANESDNGLSFIYSTSNNGSPESWTVFGSIDHAELDNSSQYVWIGAKANDADSSLSANINSFYVKSPVPVPAAVWLLGSGLLGLLGVRRKISK